VRPRFLIGEVFGLVKIRPTQVGFDLARAVVPPPRLHASPFAFDAGDAGGVMPAMGRLGRGIYDGVRDAD
jgi:hypothetical protein